MKDSLHTYSEHISELALSRVPSRFSCFSVLHFVAWSCVVLSCHASLDPNVLSGAITRLCCVADLHSLRHGSKVLTERRGCKSVDWAVASFQWKSLKFAQERCTGTSIGWGQLGQWLGHCNIRDNCEIRGLISPAKLWWRVFLGFLGLGWLSHRQIAPDEFKHPFMMMLLMPYDAFLFLWCLFHPFSLCFRPLKAYCGPRTSHLARDHYAHSLVTACSRAGAKSVQKQHLHTSHMPFKRWAMPQDAYTFGLKFGLKWPKLSWKKLRLATAQSSWCLFGSWMNFQCNCLAY